LPEFDAPPLFETVFGVRFPRLKGWDIRHFGLLWDHVRADYPRFETKPPLPSPGVFRGEGLAIQLVSEPEVRCWYLVPDGTRLLQVQHDGFFHNWRKVTLVEAYPRYATIRPAFERAWRQFQAFLAERNIDSPQVVECEATYVNHFEKGREWTSPEDQPQLLRWLASDTPRPSRLNLSATISVHGYNLDVVLTPAVRRNDGQEIMQMNITTRGQPKSSDTDQVMAWMDGARAAIVRGFADLTTEAMHKLWKRSS
jgi:uncharacterized protein (TIGR04255 family)